MGFKIKKMFKKISHEFKTVGHDIKHGGLKKLPKIYKEFGKEVVKAPIEGWKEIGKGVKKIGKKKKRGQPKKYN